MSLKCDKNNGHFTKVQFSSVLFGNRNISDNACRENQNMYFMSNNVLFRQSCSL
jgi:hypothetical protein